MASYRLTFTASLIAALVNVVFGLLLAWVLVRYSFPGKRVVSAINNDELRTRDAVVKHPRVVDRYRLVLRSGDDERRASDLGEAASAVERHRLLPGG